MKPHNEVIATRILQVLERQPAGIEELSTLTRQTASSCRYVVTQLVKRKAIVRLEGHRYGHAERLSQSTPPPSFRSDVRAA